MHSGTGRAQSMQRLPPGLLVRVRFNEVASDSDFAESSAAKMHFSSDEIRKVFRALDKPGNGAVTAKQLGEVMKKMGTPISESEARNIVQAADKKGTGMITEEDFVSYMRDRALDFTRQLREAFQAMDTDKSGFLTPSQLRSGFAKQGMTFSNQEFKDMLAVVDVDKSGGISWEEFLSAMQ